MDYVISPEKLIDVTMPLSGTTPSWPGDVRFSKDTSLMPEYRTSKLTMSSHSGTHIDPPAHMACCDTFVTDIPLTSLILPAVVADCRADREITEKSIEKLSFDGKALLLKTVGNPGRSTEIMDFSYLLPSTAEMIVSRKVRTVGIDTLSVDAPDSLQVHRILLKASVPIIENLVLSDVDPGNYLLICLPLRIESGDGSPVRAFLQPL
jgi:arylformamidase